MLSHDNANSFHTTRVDPENLWWQGNAWNDTTFAWFTSPKEANLRLRALFGGVAVLAGNTIPKIVPSSEWLAQVYQANPSSRLDESLFESDESLPYSLRLAHHLNTANWDAVQAEAPKVRPDDRIGAARIIYSIFEFTEENYEAAMGAIPDHRKPWMLQTALPRNPSLAALAPRGKDGERPYLTLLKSALEAAVADTSGVNRCLPRLIKAVAANMNVTFEDIQALECEVDKWLASSPGGPFRAEVQEVRNAIYAHPNYPVPGYNDPDGDTALSHRAFEACYTNPYTRGYVGLSYGGMSKTEEKRIMEKAVPSIGNFYPEDIDHHWFLLSRLASNFPASANSLLRLRLKKVAAGDQHGFVFQLGTIRLIGELAPALGYVFAKAAKKLGADADAVPLEWLEEFI